MLINYTNHAVNLILYILTSATFRRDFKEFFCFCKRPNDEPIGNEKNEHEHLKLNHLADEDSNDEHI